MAFTFVEALICLPPLHPLGRAYPDATPEHRAIINRAFDTRSWHEAPGISVFHDPMRQEDCSRAYIKHAILFSLGIFNILYLQKSYIVCTPIAT